jgi:ornithine carbamoyltransferase
MLMTRFGAHVTLAHPEGYTLMEPCLDSAAKHAGETGGSFTVTGSMDEAFRDADVVYPKSWGPYDLMLERVAANQARDSKRMGEIEKLALERNAKHRDWICDERRMALTKGGDALYMHCLPADIGAEVTPGVMARHTVNVAREASWKAFVIMALLATAKVPDLSEKLAAF